MGLATNASTVGQRAAVLRLLKKLRTALQPQSSISWMSGKVPRGISTPSVYSFRYPSPRCFSCPLLSVPFPDILAGVFFKSFITFLSYFDTGAGAVVLGAETVVLGAGVAFTAAVLGAGFAGAAEL